MMGSPFGGNRKRVLTIAAVVLAIVLALGAGIALRAAQSKQEAEKRGIGLTETLSQETTDAQNLAAEGKTEEANKYINDRLAKPDLTDTQKYDLYMQQGVILLNEGKFAEAIESIKKAEALKKTRQVYSLMAEASLSMGNKEGAIQNWKQEIQYLNKQSPLYDDDKGALEEKIRSQGGSV